MIGRLYRWLFDTHRHEWETINVDELVRRKDKSKIGDFYTLRCKTCGEVRGRKVWLLS